MVYEQYTYIITRAHKILYFELNNSQCYQKNVFTYECNFMYG